MPFCNRCGRQLDAEMRFCYGCGQDQPLHVPAPPAETQTPAVVKEEKTVQTPATKPVRKEPKLFKKKAEEGKEYPPLGKTRTADSNGELGDFSTLEKKPGVVVVSSATHDPRVPSASQLKKSAALRRAGYTVTEEGPGRIVLAPNPLSKQLSAAKSRYYLGMTQTIFEAYKGMEKHYRWYRSDALVRGCIDALAYWSTKEGFDTVLEPIGEDLTPEQEQQIIDAHADLKDYIDKINMRVNLDHVLRVAVIKGKIYGKAGFEIELNNKQEPNRLLSLPFLSLFDLRPDVDQDWVLQGFWWRGQKDFYKPSELLYFTNSAIESDYEGISAIEPILDDLETRGKIRQEDLKEAVTTLWAGIAIHSLDIDRLPPGLTQDDIQAIINEHVAALRPGKHIATDNRWEINVIDLKPDLEKLVRVKTDIDQEIIGNFQVPKFILNRSESVNRATSYSQLEAFVDGPITDNQRWLARTVEAQWYDPLTRAFLKVPDGQDPEVRVRHRWREIRTSDFYQLLLAVSTAVADGFVDQAKGYELMRDGPSATFDPAEVQQLDEGTP